MRVGMRVVDIGDRRIGELIAIDGDRFHVSLIDGDRVWLRVDAFLTVRKDEVQVVCNVAGLVRYQDTNATPGSSPPNKPSPE